MDPEIIEKQPVRRWNQLTSEEQRQEISALRRSRFFRLLSQENRDILNSLW